MKNARIYADVSYLTASALVNTGAGFLFSILIGTDGVNDPVVTAYNDTDGSTAANRIVPITTYDASALGINGFVLQFAKKFTTGLYVSIANLGSGEVTVDYRAVGSLSPYKFV